ncbi:MAG: glycosyltransferase family 39 protein [Acidobacteriota bacterium]|nr:glycosyltransferase family 39 protein [Acidobacteriota bacterium]
MTPSSISRLQLWWSKARTSFGWIVLLAFALRFAYILIAHTYALHTRHAPGMDSNFSFGWEMGRVGRSLAAGDGFASPFNSPSGLTAWEPPLYPYLIAWVFKAFGIYSKSSAFVLLTLNSSFSALTCIPIFFIARRCFSEKVAVWSAWTWALLPSVLYWCTRWVWETSLAAFLLALLFWLALSMEDRDGLLPWIKFGALWGIAALVNTSLLGFLPAGGLWIWYRRHKDGKRSLAGVVLASLIFATCLTPWLLRNYQAFGRFIFIRSNFGAELRMGNGPGANGTWMEYLHPTENVLAMRRYRELGEIAYVAERKREAVEFIRADYGRFARLSLARLIYYWAGIPKPSENAALAPFQNSLYLASSVLALWGLGRALRRHQPGAWLFFWLVVSYPAIFYFVFPLPRYRHPIEAELLILMVYVISQARTKKHVAAD